MLDLIKRKIEEISTKYNVEVRLIITECAYYLVIADTEKIRIGNKNNILTCLETIEGLLCLQSNSLLHNRTP
jgi:hypothetical protein